MLGVISVHWTHCMTTSPRAERFLLLAPLYRRKTVDPGKCGPLPYLKKRQQVISLVEQADTQTDLRGILLCHSKYGGSTFRAERLNALGTTFCDLHIALGLTVKNEGFNFCRNNDAEGRTRELLAVCAMTDHYLIRINGRSDSRWTHSDMHHRLA